MSEDIRLRVVPIRMVEAGSNGSDTVPLELIIKDDTQQLFFKGLDDSVLEIKGKGYDTFLSALKSLYSVDTTTVNSGGIIPTKAFNIDAVDTDIVVRFDKGSFEDFKDSTGSDFTRESAHIMLYKKGEKPKLIMPKVSMNDIYIHNNGEYMFWANNNGKLTLPDLLKKIFNLYNGTSLINYDNTVINLTSSYTYAGTPINSITGNTGGSATGKTLNDCFDTRIYFLQENCQFGSTTTGFGPMELYGEDRVVHTYKTDKNIVYQVLISLESNRQYSRYAEKDRGAWSWSDWKAGNLPVTQITAFDFKRYTAINDITNILPFRRVLPGDASAETILKTQLGHYRRAKDIAGVVSWDDVDMSGFYYSNPGELTGGADSDRVNCYRFCEVATSNTNTCVYQKMTLVTIPGMTNVSDVLDTGMYNNTIYTRSRANGVWSAWTPISAFAESRVGVNTYRDNTDYTLSAIRSYRKSSKDCWLYLDRNNPQIGIYHNRHDTSIVVAGEETIPGNSLAYIGKNSPVHYVDLNTGNAWFKGRLRASEGEIGGVAISVSDTYLGKPTGTKVMYINGKISVNDIYTGGLHIGNIYISPTSPTSLDIGASITVANLGAQNGSFNTITVGAVAHGASDNLPSNINGSKFYSINGQVVVNKIIANGANIGGIEHTVSDADPGAPTGTKYYSIPAKVRVDDIKTNSMNIGGIKIQSGKEADNITNKVTISGNVRADKVFNAVWGDVSTPSSTINLSVGNIGEYLPKTTGMNEIDGKQPAKIPQPGEPIDMNYLNNLISRLTNYVNAIDALIPSKIAVGGAFDAAASAYKVVRRNDLGLIPGVKEYIDTEVAKNSRFVTGMWMEFYGNSAPSGWVIAMGQTIGSQGILNDEETHGALFNHIKALTGSSATWGGAEVLYVPDGRGVSTIGAGVQARALWAQNNTNYNGGNVGDYIQDQLQDHVHDVTTYEDTGGGIARGNASKTPYGNSTGGVHANFRKGAITRAATITLNYIIKL